MVKPLPQGCRLTAVLDVSQSCAVLDYSDTFLVLQLWDTSWYVVLENFDALILTSFKISPTL